MSSGIFLEYVLRKYYGVLNFFLFLPTFRSRPKMAHVLSCAYKPPYKRSIYLSINDPIDTIFFSLFRHTSKITDRI